MGKTVAVGARLAAAAFAATVAAQWPPMRPAQFILFSVPFSGNCANTTAASWEGMLTSLKNEVLNGTAGRHARAEAVGFGAHVLLNVLNCDGPTLANQTRGLLDAAVATGVPVFLGLDAQVWWQDRPELWNHWDAAAPGYDPRNAANVEWTSWSATDALEVGWLNWGRQMRMVPPQNVHAPAVLAAAKAGFTAVGAAVAQWWQVGDDDDHHSPLLHRTLLAGIKVGCEAGIGWQVWAYPNANALYEAHPRNGSFDPTSGANHSAPPDPPTWGLAQIGFAAATAAGLPAATRGGALTNRDVQQLTTWYLANLTDAVLASGVPAAVLMTHYGGTLVPRAGGAPTMAFAGGELPGIALGVSLYVTPLDEVPSFAPAAARAEGWGAVEFGLANFWAPPGVPTGSQAAWLAAMNRTLSLGRCKLISQVPASAEAIGAAQALLFDPAPVAGAAPAPLQATEVYRSRVHTAGHYCCPGGAASCNATEHMRATACDGYYDHGSPQLLLTLNGTLLAFNQAERVAHQDDNNWIDIVVKRSFDRGATWQPTQVVHSENTWATPASQYQSIGQNTAVLDRTTGVVHLLFARNNTAVLHTSSPDHGASWAAPVPVPDKPGCAGCWIAPSFSAIQLQHNRNASRNGNLVACLDYSNLPGHQGGGPVERSGTLVSEDGGASWIVGATDVLGDECAIAELANGTVVLNARNYVNQSAKTVHRSVAWSDDGGRSFSPVVFPATLPDPVVEGSMVWGEHTDAALGVGKPLFFTNPASETARQGITLKMSVDGAATWSSVHLVQAGCGMYSSVVQFDDGSLGVQWDDAHDGPVTHAGLANETFVRLVLSRRASGV